MDMLASATPEQYRRATALLLADAHVDSLLVIFVPPLVTRPADVASAISSGSAAMTKPVIATFMGSRNVRRELGRIPSYRFPESAVTALARATTYGAWRRRPRGSIRMSSDLRPEIIRQTIEGALSRGHGWLPPAEAKGLVEAAGVSTASTRMATTTDEAAAVALQIGYPVALKAAGPEIVHQTDVGGVTLNIPGETDLRDAFSALKPGRPRSRRSRSSR